MAVFVPRTAEWMEWIAPDRFNDADLFKIVTFFVFHSPCDDLSSMGRSLAEYGWSTPWRKPFYLNKQLKQASTNKDLLFSANNLDTLEAALQKADLFDNFPSDLSTERIAIYNCKRNQFMSVFYHIRNSFAHCRLNMLDVDNECVFVMEDINSRHNEETLKVSARMILRKSTLLKWIDIIEAGESEFIKNGST